MEIIYNCFAGISGDMNLAKLKPTIPNEEAIRRINTTTIVLTFLATPPFYDLVYS
ncbi:MAG: hypothetical protein PF444_00160 [Bacteroidales bacterium]|jgi:uncharacterized protein (DUF111 family)|nr:hypothetical protein [Bacteroidales bacterium]